MQKLTIVGLKLCKALKIIICPVLTYIRPIICNEFVLALLLTCFVTKMRNKRESKIILDFVDVIYGRFLTRIRHFSDEREV